MSREAFISINAFTNSASNSIVSTLATSSRYSPGFTEHQPFALHGDEAPYHVLALLMLQKVERYAALVGENRQFLGICRRHDSEAVLDESLGTRYQ